MQTVLERLIDFGSIRFGEPLYLWLLVRAGGCCSCCGAGRSCAAASMPASTARRGWCRSTNDSASIGELGFWLALIAALSLTILALSRPQGITAIVRSPGVDIVLLMDGSTSMRVRDMGTDRWQRAMQWVRTLTKTLSWNGDRMALATFADIAVPQVRLTRDPNTILFFLDHLDDAPTFRLENETSWNTNVEDAIYWGVKLVETDQEMYGRSKNARTFVVISDGQVWSGNVQRAIAAAAQRGISVDVIGVGTSNGGIIPLPRDDKGVVLAGFEPIRSTIDRTSLREIARAGNGEYFELGTAADEQIAARIIQNAARRSGNEQVDEAFDELYWYLLAAAAGCRRPGSAVREAARAARASASPPRSRCLR